jgi:hypothetical protein
MNKITKDNLNEFIKYYYEFHDIYIINGVNLRICL